MSTSAAAIQKRHHWLVYLLLGLFAGVFFLALALISLETIEAPYRGGMRITSLEPDWSLLLQMPLFLLGKLDPSQQAGALVGWSIEMFYVLSLFVNDIFKDSQNGWWWLSVVGAIASRGILIVDVYTSLQYGMPLGSNDWIGYIIFTAVTVGLVFLFGSVSVRLIDFGLRHRK